MAEPLSVASSIAGVITLAEVVFRRTYESVNAVKNAQEDVSALPTELVGLFSVLHVVHLKACQLEGESFTVKIHCVNQCYSTLKRIQGLQDKSETKSRKHDPFNLAKRNLRWPMSKSETKQQLISEVERHKSTLTLSLTADGASGLMQALSGQESLREAINEIKSHLQDRDAAKERITLTKGCRRLLDDFSKLNPQQKHELDRRLRYGENRKLVDRERLSWSYH